MAPPSSSQVAICSAFCVGSPLGCAGFGGADVAVAGLRLIPAAPTRRLPDLFMRQCCPRSAVESVRQRTVDWARQRTEAAHATGAGLSFAEADP